MEEIRKQKEIISIHAPTRGATSLQFDNIKSSIISIHAPTRGATRLPGRTGSQHFISIHAPTRGATLFFRICQNDAEYFNPRSYKRSDCDTI